MRITNEQPRGAERRRLLRAGVAAVTALTLPSLAGLARAARADTLRLLCSGPGGSIPDLIVRSVGEQLAGVQGRRVVVDNKPGAAGQISVGALKSAPADGSTLLLAQGAIATVYPYLYARLGYDASVDLKPVSLAGEMSLALAVGPAVPAEVSTLADFIAWLRRHPAQANIGSPGTGTLPHLLSAMLFGEEKLTWQPVAYAGGPPAVNDLLGGRLAGLVLPEGLLQQHHATRRARVVATSGPVRSAYLPDVPSFAEQGHPDLVVKEWFAFFAPGRTPAEAVVVDAAALKEAIARPEVAATLAQAGISPASSSPAALSARIAAEQRHWQNVLRIYGIHAE
ncbi:MAG: tripartite tricarboxylate transporter substrate-binding protein [Caldimonas sp.]